MWFVLLSLSFVQLWTEGKGLGLILCHKYHFYLEEDSHRFTSIEFGLGGVVNCLDFGKLSKLQSLYIKLPLHCVTNVNEEGMTSVMKLCPKIEQTRLISSLILDQLPKFRYNIFPGTNWCGAGNISRSYDDVGIFSSLDSCCRAHDSCPVDGIGAGETKFNLTNNKVGTISFCECDDKFYNCLRDVKHIETDNVGFTFFNVLAMPCFKKDYPIVKCLEYGGLLNNQCQKYEQDTTKEPIYQLFDSKIYYPMGLRDIVSS